MKLTSRLAKLEKNLKPAINWPTFQQFYDTKEEQRAWFELHNPSYDFEEWQKGHKSLEDCYE